MASNETGPSSPGNMPDAERIRDEPLRNLGEIIALVSDEIGERIQTLKEIFADLEPDERDRQIALLLAELETAERIGVLAGIEPDLLEELRKITNEQARD